MGKILAIKGHATCGKEVIELLEMMGGVPAECVKGFMDSNYYYISEDTATKYIYWKHIGPKEIDKYEIFTLEEFLEKFPFKVGDKVFLYDNITEGCVTGMEWDEDKGTVKYCVYTSAECWCDVKELLKWNNIDLDERHYRDNIEEKDKAKAPDMKGEDYSGKRFGYKIPDGYEFDVVVDGKVFLKPIKPKYPTTYEDCCKLLYPNGDDFNLYLRDACLDVDEINILDTYIKLRRCRNAYWKIAGKQMGLGKPWEPEYVPLIDNNHHTIHTFNDKVEKSGTSHRNAILAFPTEEMRDAFYENFKDLIEECKELL